MAYQDVGTSSGNGSTTDTAKEQAGRVGQSAAQAGGEVAQTAKEQAGNVVGEAKQQARDLVGEARGQVRDQAGTQKTRAVQGLHGVSDQLDEMASQGNGVVAEVARQASQRARTLAEHVDRHEPAELLDQLRSYARRRPVAFLAGCAIAGVVAGRLTRGVVAAQQDSGTPHPALEPATDTFAAYEPPAVEPAYGTAYDPVPAYEQAPAGYAEPGYAEPAPYPAGEQPQEQPYPQGQPGQAYPGQQYPAADPNRGWNP